ncbi:MAG: FHA domain-containing protein [Polyangiaceae bacterium]
MQLPKPSFFIVVSEKGGSERRVSFTANQVSIGRVQGNDLTLNKTNVSKQHATLTYRDGVFTVSDLHSTNGTYINRRRIQEPTKLNEGDCLYIGDYVLRMELVEHPAADPAANVPSEVMEAANATGSVSDSTTTKGRIPAEVNLLGREGIARAASYPEVPAPPKVPSPATTFSSWSDNSTGRLALSTEDFQAAARASLSEPSLPGGSVATLAPNERDFTSVLSGLVEDIFELLGERWASGAVDPDQQTYVEKTIDDQLQRLLQSGTIPNNIQPERLRVFARLEVLGLGSLGKLLDDPQVTEVLVPRHDQVWVRRGAALEVVEQGLSSRRSLRRIIFRLCIKSGQPATPQECAIQRVLPNGGILWAVLPPHAPGQPSLVFRKSRESASSLQSLVRVGVVSRPMSVFLQQAVQGRGRVLIVGPRDADLPAISGALLTSVTEGPLTLLEGSFELGVLSAQVPCFRWSLVGSEDPAPLVAAAARTTNAQFGIVLERAQSVAAAVDALGSSSVGVVAVREARTAEAALSQLCNDLVTAHRGLSMEAASRMLATSFDLVLEVVRYRDGRQRLIRVAEMVSTAGGLVEFSDIFNFVASAGTAGEVVEGTFRSTGVVPRFVEALLARGATFDTNVFNRQTR